MNASLRRANGHSYSVPVLRTGGNMDNADFSGPHLMKDPGNHESIADDPQEE